MLEGGIEVGRRVVRRREVQRSARPLGRGLDGCFVDHALDVEGELLLAHNVAPTSSSQLAQASAPPVSTAPPSATNSPVLALLAVCQLPLRRADRPRRRADDDHQDGDDEAVGQQRADDRAELAGATDGTEVGADEGRVRSSRGSALMAHQVSPDRAVKWRWS